jgi:large subunit ribosomal protein L31e
MNEIRQYLAHHLSAEQDKVKLDRSINEKIWERGSSNPPSKITVRAMKFDDGVVEAELSSES